MFGESDYGRRMSNIANIEEGFKKDMQKDMPMQRKECHMENG